MNTSPFFNFSEKLILGSALWGWGVDTASAHSILDTYYSCGGRWIDTAVNYPINGKKKDFGRANKIIRDWIRANPGTEIQVFCKIGSINNSGDPETALKKADILLSTELLGGCFFEHLSGVGIHWDNRSDIDSIKDSLCAMDTLYESGFDIGFSGVKHPEHYSTAAPGLLNKWRIQVKENISTSEAREHYEKFFPEAKYIAYGINMGGIKMASPEKDSSVSMRKLQEPEQTNYLREIVNKKILTPAPENLNHLALASIWANPNLSSLIVAPRNTGQMLDTIKFWRKLENEGDKTKLLFQLTDLWSHRND